MKRSTTTFWFDRDGWQCQALQTIRHYQNWVDTFAVMSTFWGDKTTHKCCHGSDAFGSAWPCNPSQSGQVLCEWKVLILGEWSAMAPHGGCLGSSPEEGNNLRILHPLLLLLPGQLHVQHLPRLPLPPHPLLLHPVRLLRRHHQLPQPSAPWLTSAVMLKQMVCFVAKFFLFWRKVIPPEPEDDPCWIPCWARNRGVDGSAHWL